jgi:hypothetical protein
MAELLWPLPVLNECRQDLSRNRDPWSSFKPVQSELKPIVATMREWH